MKAFDQYNFKRIIIVAYRLPFKLVKKRNDFKIVQNSGGLVSAILSLSEKMNRKEGSEPKILWVGTGDLHLKEKNINPNFELHPVEIPKKINEKYYSGFCNDTIWPLFHYFPSRTVYKNSYFDAYTDANQIFLDALKEIVHPGDLIWIHDYHLFLLPEMVRKSFHKIHIGFFLHIPFPSPDLLRRLPWRQELIE